MLLIEPVRSRRSVARRAGPKHRQELGERHPRPVGGERLRLRRGVDDLHPEPTLLRHELDADRAGAQFLTLALAIIVVPALGLVLVVAIQRFADVLAELVAGCRRRTPQGNNCDRGLVHRRAGGRDRDRTGRFGRQNRRVVDAAVGGDDCVEHAPELIDVHRRTRDAPPGAAHQPGRLLRLLVDQRQELARRRLALGGRFNSHDICPLLVAAPTVGVATAGSASGVTRALPERRALVVLRGDQHWDPRATEATQARSRPVHQIDNSHRSRFAILGSACCPTSTAQRREVVADEMPYGVLPSPGCADVLKPAQQSAAVRRVRW